MEKRHVGSRLKSKLLKAVFSRQIQLKVWEWRKHKGIQTDPSQKTWNKKRIHVQTAQMTVPELLHKKCLVPNSLGLNGMEEQIDF